MPPAEPKPALVEQFTATPKRVTMIDLAVLAKLDGAQLREGRDPATVKAYAEAYKNGAEFPPIMVFVETVEGDEHYHVADGHHRIAGAIKAGLAEINAITRKGTHRDAVLYAAGANGIHGLPLTNEDKRKIVKTILTDEEWVQWSNREIADKCHVSPNFVEKMRSEVEGAKTKKRKGKDGRITTVSDKPKKSKKAAAFDFAECGALLANLVDAHDFVVGTISEHGVFTDPAEFPIKAPFPKGTEFTLTIGRDDSDLFYGGMSLRTSSRGTGLSPSTKHVGFDQPSLAVAHALRHTLPNIGNDVGMTGTEIAALIDGIDPIGHTTNIALYRSAADEPQQNTSKPKKKSKAPAFDFTAYGVKLAAELNGFSYGDGDANDDGEFCDAAEFPLELPFPSGTDIVLLVDCLTERSGETNYYSGVVKTANGSVIRTNPNINDSAQNTPAFAAASALRRLTSCTEFHSMGLSGSSFFLLLDGLDPDYLTSIDGETSSRLAAKSLDEAADDQADDDQANDAEDLFATAPVTKPASASFVRREPHASVPASDLDSHLRRLICDRLMDSKVKSPTAHQLLALALVVGLDSSDERYSQHLEDNAVYKATSRISMLVAIALRDRTQAVAQLPALPDLCRMFGVDYDTLRVQAERECAA
jgi:hypothetical protein